LLPSNNRLSGTLSPDFGVAWQAMEELALNTNGFIGPLPNQWAAMGRLKKLYIS
jgi:hypothetical protein